jgi:demethylmenaquinone methyltransferase/2-methoxy-6-polyprenyl-1,4-benzoquinol methylase
MPTPAPPPIGEQPGKRDAVEQMFDSIAPQYDRLNRVLSLGIDQLWRRAAVRWLGQGRPQSILDVATGTGDLAIQALTLGPERVVGIDLSEPMLAVGRRKIAALGESDRITMTQADAADLPFEDDTFDAALVAFGVRNFENLDAGLAEIRRVLRPGGALVVLEFSTPTLPVFRELYFWYSKYVLPLIGALVSGNRGAYEYLPESVRAFPYGEAFLRRMRGVGYEHAEARPLTLGIASLYRGVKPEEPS